METTGLADAAEPVADDLVARADSEDDGAAACRPGEAAVGTQPVRCQDLRQVLTAAEQVDIALAGYRLV